MTKENRAPDDEIGDNLSHDQRLQLWQSRTLRFRLKHRWNVITAFARRQVSWRNALIGIKYPDQVMWLALRPPARGMLPVCPAVIAEIDHIDRSMAQHSGYAEGSVEMAHAFHDREDDLQHCRICGGAEGSLPTQCPGRRMTDAEESAVHGGQIDFVDGAWLVAERNGHRMAFTTTAAGAAPADIEAKANEKSAAALPDSASLWEHAWNAKCAELSDAANRSCGLVYELFELRLGASIDSALQHVPAHLQARAIEIAIRHGYTTRAQRDETERMLQESDACSHGLDPDCCPMGCGDLDDGTDDERFDADGNLCQACGTPAANHGPHDACEFVAARPTPEPPKDDGSSKKV